MARLCKIVKEEKRKKLVQKAKTKRDNLRTVVKSVHSSFEEKATASSKLNSSPRNESAVRLRSRCLVCGRSRSVYRKFGLCRIHLREFAMCGDIPGLVKASW